MLSLAGIQLALTGFLIPRKRRNTRENKKQVKRKSFLEYSIFPSLKSIDKNSLHTII